MDDPDPLAELKAAEHQLGYSHERTDWQPIDTAPRDGRLIHGTIISGLHRFEIRPMRFGGLKPQTDADGSFAFALFPGGIWWAKYSDGKIGSYGPTHWREP